jgi:hypothetical protein
LAGGAALEACGGSGKNGVEQLLDTAFRKPIRSADVKIDATLEANGLPGLGDPLRVQASGPYRQTKRGLPSFDIDLKLMPPGGGQVISSGFLSTGERAFAKFEDSFYELPRESVVRANRALRPERRRGMLRRFGLDARSWLVGARVVGDEDVAGVPTRHVVGTLDVRHALSDLNALAERSGRALAPSAGRFERPLSAAEIDRIARIVKNPSFNVYIGKKDDIIRRLSGRVEFQVAKADRAAVGGLRGGSIEFSVEFSNVDGKQAIQAPARARPLSELTRSLGTGGVSGTLAALGAAPPTGSGDRSPGGAASAPDRAAFKKYARCLDEAKPDDTAALQRCSKLLH